MAVGHVELGEDVGDVPFDGFRAQAKFIADLGVREVRFDQAQYVEFALGQLSKDMVHPGRPPSQYVLKAKNEATSSPARRSGSSGASHLVPP